MLIIEHDCKILKGVFCIIIYISPGGINKSSNVIRHFCFHWCFSKGLRIKKRGWSHDRKHWIYSEFLQKIYDLYKIIYVTACKMVFLLYSCPFSHTLSRSHSCWQAPSHRVGKGRSPTLRVLHQGRCLSQKYSCTKTWLKSLVDKL